LVEPSCDFKIRNYNTSQAGAFFKLESKKMFSQHTRLRAT
jgi:hypothetical protein